MWSPDAVEAACDDILEALRRPIVEEALDPLEALKRPMFEVSPQHTSQDVERLAASTGLDRSLLILAAKRLEKEGRVSKRKDGRGNWYTLR